MNKIGITSEIGRLRGVVIHTPGHEVEAMTPNTALMALYNDIIPLSVVAEEHRHLKEILSVITDVYEVTDLAKAVFEDSLVRRRFVQELSQMYHIPHRIDELSDMSSGQLVEILITGLPKRRDSLAAVLSPDVFDINPLPNLYFTRDASFVFQNRVIIGAMANRVRQAESLLMKYLFENHPVLQSTEILFEGNTHRVQGKTIEGGDAVVLGRDLLLIGISQRTNAEAVDELIHSYLEQSDEELTVLAVVLPDQRHAIHLDMILTVIDHQTLLVYRPYVEGPAALPIVRIRVSRKGREYSRVDGLVPELKRRGINPEIISCGGDDPVFQQREQWLSGTNFFAFAPGKIIGYDCNTATFEALRNAGFRVKTAEEVKAEPELLTDSKRLAVGIQGAELARGGGGIRCMTLPVLREEVV
ncbi:MAG: hypothetical protein K9L68_10655 [Spirochaetales bacterium]|nr:hypothetical protein [Spirochaetales bacterium]MCF7939044.1 hypothetical protein [Spirochaetales bacterium]